MALFNLVYSMSKSISPLFLLNVLSTLPGDLCNEILFPSSTTLTVGSSTPWIHMVLAE